MKIPPIHLYLISDTDHYSDELVNYFDTTKKSPIVSFNKFSTKENIDQHYIEKVQTILQKSNKTYPKAYILIINNAYRPLCQLPLFNDILTSALLSTHPWDVFHFSNIPEKHSYKLVDKTINNNLLKFYKVINHLEFNVVLISPTGRNNLLALDNIKTFKKNHNKFCCLSLGHNLFNKYSPDDQVKDIPYIWFLIITIITIILASCVFISCRKNKRC